MPIEFQGGLPLTVMSLVSFPLAKEPWSFLSSMSAPVCVIAMVARATDKARAAAHSDTCRPDLPGRPAGPARAPNPEGSTPQARR
jgi:hypothetical protein